MIEFAFLVWIAGVGKHQNTAMLEKSKSFKARGAANTVLLDKSKKSQFSRSMALKPTWFTKLWDSWDFPSLTSVWGTSCPKTLGFSRHYSVWCTSELRNTAMLQKSQSFQARGAAHTVMREKSQNHNFPDLLWPSSLHNFQKVGIHGIFQALQCLGRLGHLMPQNFGIFRITVLGVPQSYETPQCSKIPKVLRQEVQQTL